MFTAVITSDHFTCKTKQNNNKKKKGERQADREGEERQRETGMFRAVEVRTCSWILKFCQLLRIIWRQRKAQVVEQLLQRIDLLIDPAIHLVVKHRMSIWSCYLYHSHTDVLQRERWHTVVLKRCWLSEGLDVSAFLLYCPCGFVCVGLWLAAGIHVCMCVCL